MQSTKGDHHMAKFQVQTHYSDKLAKKAAVGNKPMLSRVPEHLRVTDFDRAEHMLGHGNPFASRFDQKK
jgi:hypothetical protein